MSYSQQITRTSEVQKQLSGTSSWLDYKYYRNTQICITVYDTESYKSAVWKKDNSV